MKNSLFSTDGTYARIMNLIWNLIVISVLWVICCIPVVTIGAATVAAYYTAAKVIRAGEGKAGKEFFHAFRLNFKQATVFTLIYIAVLLLLILDCVYVYHNSDLPLSVLYMFYGMVAIVVANSQFLFICMSRFSDKNFQLFRMATICSFRKLLRTILLLFLFAALILGIYLMPWGVLIFPGILFLAQTFLMEPVLRQMMPKLNDDDPELKKWYYNIK